MGAPPHNPPHGDDALEAQNMLCRKHVAQTSVLELDNLTAAFRATSCTERFLQFVQCAS